MKYLLSPNEYLLPNPRIDGFKKLKEVGARTVDIYVLSLDLFSEYLKTKQFPEEFLNELKEVTEKIISEATTHAVVVRRAFVVPNLENPPGPRFLGLTTMEAVEKAVRELYDFAISQNYSQTANSQTTAFIYPFIDPPKFNDENPNLEMIPYGGYAVSQNEGTEIYSVFGNNEGVQSLVADRYLLDTRRGKLFIVKKEIPQKNLMLCTTEKSESETVNVPTELQFDQVLSDSEILEVARVVYELSQKYGPQRIEFSTDEKGICFNEVADYYRKEIPEQTNIKISGLVMTLNNLDDLTKLATVDKEKLDKGEITILVGEEVITNRNYDVLGSLAAWKDKLYVLYPGVAATQHAMRILADKGHRAFLVGTQKFADGDKVQIATIGGKVRVTNLSRAENQKVISLWDANLLGVELCGGKAQRLSELKVFGFQVPHGSVCTTILFDEISQVLNESKARATVDQLLPDYRKSNRSFAVRSSATIEDSHQYSMAGIFDSYLNVSPENLTKRIIDVLRSTFSQKATEYLRHYPELVKKMKMAVVVQEMVPAKFAGVIFGAKVQTGDYNIVEIEVNRGLGEALVSGNAAEVEYYSFNRQERRVIERKGPIYLTQSQAKALLMLSDRLRSEFSDVPQDIEWAIDDSGQIWVIQSRDLYLGGTV